MLREKHVMLDRLHRLLDLMLTVSAYASAYFIKKKYMPIGPKGLALGPNYSLILLMIIIIWYLVLHYFRSYESYRRRSLEAIVFNVIKSVCTGFLILMLCMYFLKIFNVSRSMLIIFFTLDIIFLISSKSIVFYFLHKMREKGYNYRSIVIIGSMERAKDVLRTIMRKQGTGYHIIGCIDTAEERVGKEVVSGIRVIDTVDNIEQVLTASVVDELIFAMPMKLINHASRYVTLAETMGINVRIIPDWQLHYLMYEPDIATIQFENFLDIPTMTLHMTTPNIDALIFKHMFDYIFSTVMLILFLPFFVLIALAIKLSSRGPVFYTQERVSVNGRLFKLYKFRTMVQDADMMLNELMNQNESDGPVFKIRKDPRIIPFIGQFLRKTSLDELPQLFNVLRGEMSLIGPRPPIPGEVEKYEIWQRRRLSMKPGLSCIWQISPRRNDISFEGWMKMDLDYIDNWSVWLDCKILLLTMRAVLFGAGR